MRTSHTRAARVAAVAIVATVLALAPATTAEAADEVSVSSDGTTWGSTLSGPLFGTIIGLVPEEIRTETLWVRNSSAMAVRLRITLDSTTWTDLQYAEAMSVGAASPGASGTTASAASAGSCRMLLSGVTLDPGEAIPVTMTLALGSLTGRTGQDETVAMALGVTVIEDAGPPSSGDCSTPSLIVPLTPPIAAGLAPTPSPTAGSATPDPRPTEAAESPLFVFASMAGFNSNVILWALIAALGGSALFYFIEYLPWRRRHDHLTVSNAEPEERHVP